MCPYKTEPMFLEIICPLAGSAGCWFKAFLAVVAAGRGWGFLRRAYGLKTSWGF